MPCYISRAVVAVSSAGSVIVYAQITILLLLPLQSLAKYDLLQKATFCTNACYQSHYSILCVPVQPLAAIRNKTILFHH